MTQKIFDLIDSINREGIDNGIWSVYDLGKMGFGSREFFGTVENVTISGKVLVVYVKDDDSFAWFKPETSDITLTMAEDEKIHIWHI